MRTIFFALLVINFSVPVSADEAFEMQGNLEYQRMDAFAKANKLLQLRSSGSNELRLWFEDSMGRSVSALVLSKGESFECQTKMKYNESEVLVRHGNCKKINLAITKDEINRFLSDLEKLKSKNTSCDGESDGIAISVDGVYQGQRFSYVAYNPQACTNENTLKFNEVVEEIYSKKKT